MSRNSAGPQAPRVPSPCTGVCRIDEASGWCVGCARSLAEIAAWSATPDAARRALWKQLPARRATLRASGVDEAPGG